MKYVDFTSLGELRFFDADGYRAMPEKTGCYMFLNDDGQVEYIGKAINLLNRVRIHHSTSEYYSDNIMYVVEPDYMDASILEMILIVIFEPKYNRETKLYNKLKSLGK